MHGIKNILFISLLLLVSCSDKPEPGLTIPEGPGGNPQEESEYVNNLEPKDFPGVPLSDIYEVSITRSGKKEKVLVFQNTCPEYQLGYLDMKNDDYYPLNLFKGRSISWANFSFNGQVDVEVKVISPKIATGQTVKILPSRFGITPQATENTIKFTITTPGQYSVEIGPDGYKTGLMVFANPQETDIPQTSSGYTRVENATQQTLNAIPSSVSGIYFESGVHDIGVYKVPANIKNIYFKEGSWVYGSLIMDKNPDVRIFGRGVLSSGRMKYRETHCIEAINGSDRIRLEGIVVADPKYFSIRLIGTYNIVKYVKVIGGWTYNCDGIAAFKGSQVTNCFIWANDDNIKVYRDDVLFSDCVCWQLNNGGLIQFSWGNVQASNVVVRKVDILHAEWNSEASNRGIVSCVGDKFMAGGMSASQKNYLIEDIVTETPVPIVFNIAPTAASPNVIEGMVFKNWKILLDTSKGYYSHIESTDPLNKFTGFVFDNVVFNNTRLTAANWQDLARVKTANLNPPEFK